MKFFERLFYIAIIGIFILFWFKGCENSNDDDLEKETVIAPEVKGSFETQKPEYIIERDTEIVIKWRDKEVVTDAPVNENYLIDYLAAKDSLERLQMFLESISIKQFKNTFEDSLTLIEVYGSVQGKLNNIGLDYMLKERAIEFTPKKTVFRLLAGFQIQNNNTFSEFSYLGNLGFQNRKGNILRVGYGKLQNESFYAISYDFTIFRVRR